MSISGSQLQKGSNDLSALSRLLRFAADDLRQSTATSLSDYVDWPPISEKQAEIIHSPARFKVVKGGRRGGKTTAIVSSMLDDLCEGLPIWYAALTYKNVEDVWREMMRRTRRVPGRIVSKTLREIEFPNGGRLGVRSLQEFDNLRGSGLARLYIDEYAYVHPDAWPLVLEPMLLERRGGAWFAGSPNGMNHYHKLYMRAVSGDPDYAAFKLTAYDNPIVDPSEMERIRLSVPEHVWLQEYLGEFLPDGGSVFRNVRACATAQPLTAPESGRQYIIGVDLAKVNDFTWFVVMDTHTRHVVYVDRFNQVDYTIQLDRLEALNTRFRPTSIIVERNIGEMFIEQGYRRNLPILPFQTTHATKQTIIDNLAMGFEQGDIAIPEDEVLIGELQAFETSKTPSGLVKYAAPEGFHDDGVIALALAYYHAKQYEGSGAFIW